jgi:hypothetical protein
VPRPALVGSDVTQAPGLFSPVRARADQGGTPARWVARRAQDPGAWAITVTGVMNQAVSNLALHGRHPVADKDNKTPIKKPAEPRPGQGAGRGGSPGSSDRGGSAQGRSPNGHPPSPPPPRQR